MKTNTTLLVEDFYKKSLVIPDGYVLTGAQNIETLDTYESSAYEYSKVEWATYSCIKSNFDTRKPFVEKLISCGFVNLPILVLGCGSGRDTYYLCKSLYKLGSKGKVYSCDYSKQMVKIARKKVFQKLVDENISFNLSIEELDLRNLNKLIDSFKFGSIFCESALSHLSQEDLNRVLNDFGEILSDDGIAFLGFRLKNSDESNVYTTEGDFGRRHYLRISMNELRKLLFEKKFEIIWGPKISKHPDDKRPPFVNVIVRKAIS